jgi:hypothetical protein
VHPPFAGLGEAERRAAATGVIAAYPVLADRRPDWLGAWLAYAAEDLDGAGDRNLWRLTRRCVLEGLIERPDSDRYVELMIVGITGFKARTVRREPGDGAAVALDMAEARLAHAERWAADASGARG